MLTSRLPFAGACRTGFLFAGLCVAATFTLTATAHAQRGNGAGVGKAIDSVDVLQGRAGCRSVAVRGKDTLAPRDTARPTSSTSPPLGAPYTKSARSPSSSPPSLLLMLRDEEAADDDFTKYLPDYPTNGRRISVRRLLDHTSGIKGYTEMPEFGPMMVRDLPKDSLVALFAKEPFNFEPGEREIYNNSAYFLAGLIIEKVSGKSYADFVKERIFDKVGMKDSYYCSESTIIKGKVKGYDMSPKGLVNKGFIRHTYPYAAGSLCATAGDLLAWNRALHGGKLLPPSSYQELITPSSLNDGTKLRYALGIALHEVRGHRVIEHGGGINGFLSASNYFPDEDAVIVVLSNSTGIPADPVVAAIADRVFGKKSLSSQPYTAALSDLTGTYAGVGRGMQLTVKITAEGQKLLATVLMGPDAKPAPLRHVGNDTWDLDGQRLTFVRDGGKVTRLKVDMVYGYSQLDRQP
jgi:CubicO group peptidase (beta-lactamase class C family)